MDPLQLVCTHVADLRRDADLYRRSAPARTLVRDRRGRAVHTTATLLLGVAVDTTAALQGLLATLRGGSDRAQVCCA